jgi:battenin
MIFDVLIQIMPFIIPLTYFFFLPHNSAFLYLSPSDYEDEVSSGVQSALPYAPLPTTEDENSEEEESMPDGLKRLVALSASDKWHLVKPLLPKYMLPLCEYINCIPPY